MNKKSKSTATHWAHKTRPDGIQDWIYCNPRENMKSPVLGLTPTYLPITGVTGVPVFEPSVAL